MGSGCLGRGMRVIRVLSTNVVSSFNVGSETCMEQQDTSFNAKSSFFCTTIPTCTLLEPPKVDLPTPGQTALLITVWTPFSHLQSFIFGSFLLGCIISSVPFLCLHLSQLKWHPRFSLMPWLCPLRKCWLILPSIHSRGMGGHRQ